MQNQEIIKIIENLKGRRGYEEKKANKLGFTSLYAYLEDKILKELKTYIDKTYGEHYSKNKFQSTEFIIDSGHGEGFCIGNIMKYAQRYGRKAGKNRVDLMKIIHYAIIAIHNNDLEMKKNEVEQSN